MITHLRGILWEINPDSIIIDVNGVGYEVNVHQRVSQNYTNKGMEIHLYTYQQVLDNEIRLFGFNNHNELRLFKDLLNVTGMGTKNAVSILSAIEPGDFCRAVVYQDEKTITTIPGIGKKTAQRLIFELRAKYSESAMSVLTPPSSSVVPVHEMIEALEALGYQRQEVYPLMLQWQQEGILSDDLEKNIRLFFRRKEQRG